MAVMSTLSFLGFAILTYVVCLVIHRRFLHPLSKFPGPWLASVTDYWELYQDFFRDEGGYLFFELDKLHEKYGPIVRIRPSEIHVKDSRWIDVLYTGPSERRDRDPFVGHALGVHSATIGTSEHDLHRVRRAAINPVFSGRSINAMETALQKHNEELQVDLRKHVNEVLDMRVYLLAWTVDFITGQIFLKRENLFWDPKRAADWFGVMFDFSGLFPMLKHAHWLVTAGLVLPLMFWKIFFKPLVPFVAVHKSLLEKAEQAYSEWMSSQEEKRDDQDQSDKDIFRTLLTSNLPLKEKQPKRIADEVFNLMVAGSLSTAKTLNICIFHVLANEPVHSKLRQELLQAIPDVSTIPPIKTLQQLPYLTAVIKETLRIACIVTTRIPLISPDKALQYGTSTIPAGASVSMTYCNAAMDPSIFPEPRTFHPERWLDGGQSMYDYEHYAVPFGRGTRSCLGKGLAYAQLYLLLANLFRRFDLELFDTNRERDIDIRGRGPLGEPSRKTKGMRVLVKGVVP